MNQFIRGLARLLSVIEFLILVFGPVVLAEVTGNPWFLIGYIPSAVYAIYLFGGD